MRRVPKLLVCGEGTARELKAASLYPDAEPECGFSAAAVVEAARPLIGKGARVLRLRSDKAGPALAGALRELGAEVEDCVLYRNEPLVYETRPGFDAVLFASASAVEVFGAAWGRGALEGKTVAVIGKPTLAVLRALGAEADVVGPEATIESSLHALAEYKVRRRMAAL